MKHQLLELARKAIEPHKEVYQGAFVTLFVNGNPRGCMGTPDASEPLGELVPKLAVMAATEDDRYLPVTLEELSQLTLEISLLTPPTPIHVDAIEVGVHGLIIQKESQAALILPQIALKKGWDKKALLENLCRKGNLPKDAWQEGATLSAFKAEIISFCQSEEGCSHRQ